MATEVDDGLDFVIKDNTTEARTRMDAWLKAVRDGAANANVSVGELADMIGDANRATSAYGVEADVLISRLRLQADEVEKYGAALQEAIDTTGAASATSQELRAGLDAQTAAARGTIGQLVALTREQKEANQAGGGFGEALQGVLGKLSGLPGPIGTIAGKLGGMSAATLTVGTVAAGAVGGLIALGSAVKDVVDKTVAYNQTVMRMSDLTGINTEFLSRFAQAADDAALSSRGVGVEVGAVAAAFQRFTVNIGRGVDENGQFTEGAGRVVNALSAMGVSASDVSARLNQPEELLGLIADAFARTENPAQRSAAAFALFGQAGRDLVPILSQGSQGVRQLMSGVDAGLVVTKEGADATKRYAEQVDTLEDQWQAFTQTIGKAVIPAVTDVLKWTNENTRAVAIQAKVIEEVAKTGKVSAETMKELASLDEVRMQHAISQATISMKLNRAQRDYVNTLEVQVAAMQRSQRVAEGWSDAYSEAERRVAYEARAVQAEQEAAAGAMAEYNREALRQTEIAEMQAAHERNVKEGLERTELAARQAAQAIGNYFNTIKGGIPQAAGKVDQAKLLGDLVEGKTTPDMVEKQLLGNMTGRAAELGVGLDKLKPIMQGVKDGTLTTYEAMNQLLGLAPRMKNEFAPAMKAVQEVENIAGMGGELGNYGFNARRMQVQATPAQKTQADIDAGELAQLRAKREKLEWSFNIPANRAQMGAEWAGDLGNTRHKKELAELDKDIAEAEKKVGRWNDLMAGKVFATVTTMDTTVDPTADVATQRWQARAQAETKKANEQVQPQAMADSQKTGADMAAGMIAGATEMFDKLGGMLGPFKNNITAALEWVQAAEQVRSYKDGGKLMAVGLAEGLIANKDSIFNALTNEVFRGSFVRLIREVVEEMNRSRGR